MKSNNWLSFFLFMGGVLGGTSVLLSAWGAHGLEDLFVASPRDRFSFNYATNFQLFHALFLISLVLSAIFLVLGIFLFSFPIYFRIIGGYSELSRLTPIGGICFFLAWSLISVHSVSRIISSHKTGQNKNYE
jgi:uncharacterized membrane protein YgdD (TMEM256/DUF423 family)